MKYRLKHSLDYKYRIRVHCLRDRYHSCGCTIYRCHLHLYIDSNHKARLIRDLCIIRYTSRIQGHIHRNEFSIFRDRWHKHSDIYGRFCLPHNNVQHHNYLNKYHPICTINLDNFPSNQLFYKILYTLCDIHWASLLCWEYRTNFKLFQWLI